MKVNKKIELNSDGSFRLSAIRKWIALILIGLGGGTIYIVPYLFNSYISQISEVTGSTTQELSTLITAYGVLSIIFYIPGGWIADRISAKFLFSFSLIGTGVVSIWYSLLPFGFVDYIQLVIIHLLLAVTTVLTFWSAFVKAIKLLGPSHEQSSLYSKSDFLRNTFTFLFSFVTIAFFSIALPIFVNEEVDKEISSGLFLTILLYGFIYLFAGISSYFVLPRSAKNHKTFSVKNNKHVFFNKENNKFEIISKEKFFSLQKELRIAFWKNQFSDIYSTLKQPSVYLIGFLILFTMNIFQTIGSVGQLFLIENDIDKQTASTMQIIFFYGAPIIGSVIFGLIASKVFKNSIKTIIFGSIVLIILGIIITVLASTIKTTKNLEIAWVIAGIIVLLSVVIGGTRAIMWSVMTEAKIPVNLYGMAAGIISIIGFNNDIWLRLFLFSPIFATEGEINGEGFLNIFIWIVANAFALITISVVIYFYIKKKVKSVSEISKKTLKKYSYLKSIVKIESDLTKKTNNINLQAYYNNEFFKKVDKIYNAK